MIFIKQKTRAHQVFVFLTATFLGSASWAVPILDQSVDPTTDPGTRRISGFVYGEVSVRPPLDRAQVFAVGISGVLTDIDVMVGRLNPVTSPLLWELRDVTTSGTPGASVLATGSTPAASFPGLGSGQFPSDFPDTFISLGGLALDVGLGDVLALVLRTEQPTFAAYSWRSTPTVYTGGSQFTRRASTDPWLLAASQGDSIYAGFRTYVDPMAVIVAEPRPWALFGVGLVALGIARRRCGR